MAAIVRTARRVQGLPMPFLLGAAILLAVLGGLTAAQYRTQPTAIPFPVPVYQIEASSGSCTGSILNLGIGYVGTLEAPMPVDVNCDLLPDVLVAVNLIDIEGPVNDPLATDSTSYEDFLADRIGRTIAPNIEINRYPLNALSSILLRPSPPAKINVKLTLKDLELQEPDTIVRFGYDTGLGGSIPGQFKAVVRGLEDFFNPLEAVVDTKGDLQGGDTVPSYYEGPLTLIGGLSKSDGSFDAKLGINYKPFPDVVKVGFSSDDTGNHIDYAHGVGEQILRGYGTAMPDGTFEHYVPGELPEVDMKTTLDVLDQGDTLNLTAALDRLPRALELDFDTPTDGGRIDFRSSTDGRLPDARVNLRSVTDGELTRAEAFVEELPPELHAQWSMLDDDLASALFTTSDPDAPGFDLDNLGAGPGIGALEALFSNVDVPTEFVPFIPTEQQFVNMQTLGDEQLITARVEEIRGFKFDTRSDGFDIAARVGDGALPLEANIQIDGLPESGDLVNATATIAPLPSAIDVNLFKGTKGDLADPFKVVYKSSNGVDVDAHAELREADAADAECGEPGTTCADIGLRHLPAELTFAMGENGVVGPGATTDVAVDLVPRPGSPKPDILLDAILGKLDSVDDPAAVEDAGPVLLEAEGVLRGIPNTIRVHFVEGADKTLERLDFATCELDATEKCPAGTDPIESVEVQIRNFRDAERAGALVPRPGSVAPQFATLTSRGIEDPDKTEDPTVRFEAAARVNDITEVRYANVNGLFGVRSAVGDDSDLEVLLDIEDIIFEGNDPSTGPVDVKGRALISPLPSEIDLCLREAEFPLTLSSTASFTDRCENTNPFLDDSVTKSPMTLSYLANTDFKVDATVDLTEHGLLDAVTDDHTIHGAVVVDKVPKDLTAHIQTPPEKVPGAPALTVPERLRVRTIAPGATNTNVDLTFEDRFGGATCEDPQPAGDITCATAKITQLPVYASVVADSGPGEDTRAKVYACDLELATTTCRPGTDGLIKELSARLRMVSGDPVEEGDLVPFVFDEHPYAGATPPSGAYTLALRLDQDDDKNKELRAEGRLEDFRSLAFDKTEEGFDVRTDLGDGVKPLLASIGIDTRVPAVPDPDADPPDPDADPPEPGKLIVADTRVLPLPAQITISQHGPGDDQQADPLEFTYDSSSPVQVDARAQIFDQVAGLLCGDHGTMCATLHLDRLPTFIAATIGTFDEAVPETPKPVDVRRRMFIDLDAIPFGSVAAPDLTFDAVLGSTPPDDPPLDPEGNPIFDDTPIVAHGELRGFSEKARIRLTQSGDLQADDSLKDAKFEEALFVTCELIEGSQPPSCGQQDDNGDPVDYDEFPVREFAVSARNFHSRPTDFPVPRRTDVPDRNAGDPPSSDAMYAEAVARGDDFEAHAGFTSVREFRMRNVDEILGVLVRGGDGQGFDAHGDVAGINLPEEDLTEPADNPIKTVIRSTLAADVEVNLSNVPTKFAFCMRQQGAPIKALTGDFTEPCENQNPFADAVGQPFFDAEAPLTAPMSIAYRANDPIEQITTNAIAQIIRSKFLIVPDFGEFPLASPPTLNIKGDVTVDNLPERLTAHIETPTDKDDEENAGEEEPGGPIRALFFYDDAPSIVSGGDPVDITFDAEYTENDAVCRDIRDDQVAFCLAGKLENLPKRVKAYIDPEAELFLPAVGDDPPELVQNLRIFADNAPGQKMNLRNLDISVVKDDDPDPTKAPLVLIAEGDILGLPELVMGTIHMPKSAEEQAALADDDPLKFDKPAFDIVATPPLDKVDVVVRNFVAPDVMPPVAAARGGASVDQQIVFQQRGDFFKAEALIEDVAGGGFRTGRNALGQATETQLIRVDFGVGPDDPTIRGYVDLLTDDEDGNPTHIFADVLLDDVPHGIDVCFRGELPRITPDGETPEPGDRDHDLSPAPGTEVFCDGVADDQGAFRFQGRVTDDPEPELDVDAIFRMTKGSDTNVLKAVATVLNIPNVIEGTFGDGAVSVQSYRADGTTPAGIDDVVAEMADFDFDDDGYGAQPPWGFRVPGTVVLPPVQPGPAHEFARVAADGTDFHVKAHVGTAYDGTDGARVTKFIMDPTPCVQPSNAGSYFPYYPPSVAVDPGDPASAVDPEYICVRGELEQHSSHPLLLDADLVLDGTPIKVLDAGLSEVPSWFQATIAKTATLDADGELRRRCGTGIVEDVDEGDPIPDCMPPLLHFDSEGDSQLFGRLLLGETADLTKLEETDPASTMVDLEEHPVPFDVRGEDLWNEFPDGGTGVRLKLGEFPADEDAGTTDRKAVRASFRLDVPKALTVDQVQEWSFSDASSDASYRSAKDLRFHLVLRNSPNSGDVPVIVDVAGELAALIHNFDGNGQTLISEVGNDLGGIPIPGEFGIDLYERDHKGDGRKLIQADLRTSADLSARIRLIAGETSDIGDSDLMIRDIRGVPSGDQSYIDDPEKPSFRVRAEIKDPPDQINPPAAEEESPLLCLVWCLKTVVGDPKIKADLDLDVDNSPPVRLLEAVLNTIDDKLGAEIRTYANIDGTGEARFSADSAAPGALPVATLSGLAGEAGIHVDIDPFSLFIHAGVPVIAGFDVLLAGLMNVDLDIAPTDRFVLRNNKAVVQAGSDDAGLSIVDGISDTWLQAALSPGVLAGYLGLFWPFPPIYFFYGIAAGPVIPFYWNICPTPAHVNGVLPFNYPILPGDGIKATGFLPWYGPFPDPLFVQTIGGVPPFMKPLLDAVVGLAGPPIMCAAFGIDNMALHSGTPPSTVGDRSPGDPIVMAGHPVAGLGITAEPDPPGDGTDTPPENPSLTVTSGQTLSLCGTQVFENISIQSGGTVNVATVAGDDPTTPFVDCPANQPDIGSTPEDETVINVGRLNLTADDGMTINGTVNGPTGDRLILSGDDFTVGGSGIVNVSTGPVELYARNMAMGGLIQGNALASTMPVRSDNGLAWAASSTGNAGASHGGTGGTGTGVAGAVGPAYGSGVTDDIEPGTETGSKGGTPGAAAGGNGGGYVTLRGTSVTISGTIRMNGTQGQDLISTGVCAAPDNGDDGDEPQPNTGVPGAGGGSGGGVAIHGVTLNVTGSIIARGGRGGDGKAGGGGGGGGGVVRLNAGDVDPDFGDPDDADGGLEERVNVGGGSEGFSTCQGGEASDDFGNGQDGNPGKTEVTETPQSHAMTVDRFWFRSDDVAIPYLASAAVKEGIFGFDNDDFKVYLCGVRRGPEDVEEGSSGLEIPSGSQPTSDQPCGTKAADQDADATPFLLATVTHEGVEVSPANATLNPSGTLDPGIWGLWTVAAKPETFLSGDCYAFYPFYDNCLLESNPPSPEVVIGIDDAAPRFDVAALGTTSNVDDQAVVGTSTVALKLSSIVDDLPRSDGPGSVALSGVDGYSCFVDDGTTLAARSCSLNDDVLNLTLPDAEQSYDIYVVATDLAGNTSAPLDGGGLPDVARFDDATADEFDDNRLTVIYDKTPPAPGSASITSPASPTGANGWYVNPPTEYTITGFDDGTNGSGQAKSGGFQYRFDGADWASCTAPCTLTSPTPLPGAGTHTLSWKAIDGAALESAVSSIPILVDGTDPETAVDEIPVFVDGEWITAAHPMVVARGVDPFGGSGLEPLSSNSALCDSNPVTGPGLSGTCISVNGIGGPYVPYNGPVELDSGTDQVVCAYSVDVAGNQETPSAALGSTSCTEPLDIDNDLPTGDVTIVPPAPTGNDPWYDGDAPIPTVTFSGYDGTGSPEPIGGGFRYRVDNSTEFACADGCAVNPSLLGEGSNVLHWTVVDSAGNRAPERRVELNVDIDDPRSYLLLEKPKADGANGWHVTKPWVTLVGFDEPKGTLDLRPIGSGVDAIRYTIDGGGPITYTEPFAITPGDHNVCIQAEDVAGNAEAGRNPNCTRIAYDPNDPTTSILENGLVIPTPDGDNAWYKLSAVNVTQTSSDGPFPPASGLTPQSLGTTLCDHDRGTDPAPAGVCISVDGRAPGATISGPEFGPYTGAILLGEGDHLIRAFSVDNAGRRSEMDHNVVHIDRSDPVSLGRLRAPQASRVGLLRPWWRHQPTLVLRAVDGDQNAGIRRIEYRLNGGAIQTYATPVTMPVGIKYVEHRAIDESGRISAWKRMDVAVDVTPPVVKATFASPNPLWLHINLLGIIKLGPEKSKLQYEISDELSGKVRVRVIVYGVTGLAVRHLDGGVVDVTPGVKKTGYVLWDGKDDSLIGFLPAGVYYYRVVATDDAGNVAMSGESLGLQIKVKLVLLL